MSEWLLRAVLGGAIVCAFAATGEMFKPKTFAGMFGAAPSVALVTLGMAFPKHAPAYVATEARSMILGALGLGAYSVVSIAIARWRAVPIWIGAIACWVTWIAASFGLRLVMQRIGIG